MTSANRPNTISHAIDRQSLRPDCGNCFALDKPAGSPCQNLATDFSCTIHDSLRPRGFRGCTVFDCFGAGQNVSQGFFAGKSWIEAPDTKEDMFAAFKATRQLHEMLWYFAEAQRWTFDPDVVDRAERLTITIKKAVNGDLAALLATDLQDLHSRVRSTLMEVSAEVRACYFAAGDDHVDSSLKSGADLRGSYLIAADLRGSDLSGADLLGADFRDARIEGADLSKAMYLTQSQLNAARGDLTTLLPRDLEMPSHWNNGRSAPDFVAILLK